VELSGSALPDIFGVAHAPLMTPWKSAYFFTNLAGSRTNNHHIMEDEDWPSQRDRADSDRRDLQLRVTAAATSGHGLDDDGEGSALSRLVASATIRRLPRPSP